MTFDDFWAQEMAIREVTGATPDEKMTAARAFVAGQKNPTFPLTYPLSFPSAGAAIGGALVGAAFSACTCGYRGTTPCQRHHG